MDWTAAGLGLVLLTLCCAGKLAALLLAAGGRPGPGAQADPQGHELEGAGTATAGEERCSWC